MTVIRGRAGDTAGTWTGDGDCSWDGEGEGDGVEDEGSVDAEEERCDSKNVASWVARWVLPEQGKPVRRMSWKEWLVELVYDGVGHIKLR